MPAAIGRRTLGIHRVRGARLRIAAYASLLAAGPCWSQDMPILGVDLAPSAAEQVQQQPGQPSEAAAPRLSLTLGTPIQAPGLAHGLQPLDLGVQWRQPMLQDRHVDITAWRRMTPQ